MKVAFENGINMYAPPVLFTCNEQCLNALLSLTGRFDTAEGYASGNSEIEMSVAA